VRTSTAVRMHDDEIDVGADTVRELLHRQFPHWSELPLARVQHGGTDHHIFRVGDDLQVRLPKHAPSAGQFEKEAALLPLLARSLPVDVPEPLALGEPAAGYPFTWGVYRWLDGEPATAGTVELAEDLAAFLHALERVDVTGAPPPRGRGAPLADGAFIRSSLAQLGDEFDVAALTELWEEALRSPQWDRPPVWVHGDLLSGNLLVRDGRLSAVLDWGPTCAGDPACDFMIGWSLLSPVREEFRVAADVDDATWSRARGWALWQAAAALPYYRETNPPMAAQSRHVLRELLAEA
jgi:aminoglycoside phosphotransferase (APT) family kinase protein